MNSINKKNDNTQSAYASWPGLIVALIVAVSLSGIMDHDLWTPDEPREAAISLSMSQSGNLIVPELAGKPFVEKPPLFYVISSFFLLVFGKIIGNTAALRLVSACFGLGTLLFTYLLGKIYFDRQKALFAAGILATMFGFVHVTHWLLVDNALMFFIIASIWALAQAYESNRLPYLMLAGIFAAFAFLAKGMIGPLIIFIAWLGLFIPWVIKSGHRQLKFLGYHALALIAFGLISAIWIIAFALEGGPELFREWWWTNHFGRFSGQATELGHISPWYYYFGVLPVYILPWLAPFIAALGNMFKKIWRKESFPPGMLLFSCWIFGAFLLFSLSATKREIYLCAFLPACALFCVNSLKEQLSGLEKTIYRLWLMLLFAATALGITAPFVAHKFFEIPPVLLVDWRQIPALAAILIALFTIFNLRTPFLRRFLIVSMMLYSALLTIYCPLVDAHKNYSSAFRAAGSAINKHPELKIAAWKLDETTVAGFYYYCGLVFPPISDQKTLDDILQGRNARFNGALTLKKNAHPNDLPDGKNPVIFESRMGKRRLLQLLAAPDWNMKGKEPEK